MPALVTGASGFVGSHLVDELLARGTSVRALVHRPEAAPGLRERGVEVLVGDVRNPSVLQEAVRGVEGVYHCAAAVGPAFSPREIREVGLTGVRHLLEATRTCAAARIVLLSSINVLGTRDLDPATEEIPCRCSGDAAADVKIEIEALAREYEQGHGVDVTILRPGLIYGPRDRHNLPQMIRALRRGRFAFIGSRDNVAPIVHVSDVVQALLLAGRPPASRGRVYHITDGSRTTIGEFVGHLAELLGCPPPRLVLPFVVPYLGCLAAEFLGRTGLRRGPARINRATLRFLGTSRFVDISRARRELAYAPRIMYREGLAATVPWLEGQPHAQTAVAEPVAGNAPCKGP
jgi:nucleoside-diphosphate-sugar epimerase